ncbi:hypothetical protein HK405_010377, partial [Cladochytrium tenue]
RGFSPCVYLGNKVKSTTQVEGDEATSSATVSERGETADGRSARGSETPMAPGTLSPPTTTTAAITASPSPSPPTIQLRPSEKPSAIEEQRLISLFFALMRPFDYIHRRTFIKKYPNVDPLLISAICLVVPHLCKETIQKDSSSYWYLERAVSLAPDAIENPTLERLQGFQILTSVESSSYNYFLPLVFLSSNPSNLTGRYTEDIGNITKLWHRSGICINMCLALKLDVDPDNLPLHIQSGMSWVEKETRRRCWWSAYFRELGGVAGWADLSFYGGSPSFVRSDSTVGPPCPDELWESMDDPTVLDAEYKRQQQSSQDNPIIYALQLQRMLERLQAAHAEARTVRAHPFTRTAPFAAEFAGWLARLPAALRVELTEAWVFGALHDARKRWALNGMMMFAKAQHSICVALSSRTMEVLLLGAKIVADSDADDADGAAVVDPAAAVMDRIGGADMGSFWRAVDAAAAVATLVRLVNRANANLGDFPMDLLHLGFNSAALLAAAATFCDAAPTLLPRSTAAGWVSPNTTPHLYYSDGEGEEGPLLLYGDGGRMPLLTVPPTATKLAGLASEVRATIDLFSTTWPVAQWIAYTLGQAYAPPAEFAEAVAARCGLPGPAALRGLPLAELLLMRAPKATITTGENGSSDDNGDRAESEPPAGAVAPVAHIAVSDFVYALTILRSIRPAAGDDGSSAADGGTTPHASLAPPDISSQSRALNDEPLLSISDVFDQEAWDQDFAPGSGGGVDSFDDDAGDLAKLGLGWSGFTTAHNGLQSQQHPHYQQHLLPPVRPPSSVLEALSLGPLSLALPNTE